MFKFSRVLIACMLLFFAGCGDDVGTKIKELNATSIQRLTNVYTFYHAKNSFRGPKSEDDLRAFCADPNNRKGFDRAGIDVDAIDDLFISSRDNEPFKVKYGVKGSPMGFYDAIVFESVGVEGQVMVGLGGAKTELMSAQEADDLFKSKVRRKKKVDRGEGGDASSGLLE